MTGAPLMASRLGMKVVAELDALRAAAEDELAGSLAEHGLSGRWIPAIYDEHFGFYCEHAKAFIRYGSLVPG